MWTFLQQIWTALGPYLTLGNVVQIEQAVEKAIKAYDGTNLLAVAIALVSDIAKIVPAAQPKLDVLLKTVQ